MNYLSNNNLNALSLGAAMLGSGGGGDVACLYSLVKGLLEEKGPVPILTRDELPQDALIVPLALIGAPMKNQDDLINVTLFSSLLATIQERYPDKAIVLMPAEIGGSNALTPFIAAAEYGLSVLDGDLIGRAFPKVDLCKPAILGQLPEIAFMANHTGEVRFFSPTSLPDLENKARKISIEFNACGGIAVYLFEATSATQFLIEGSLSQALQIGNDLLDNAFQLDQFCERVDAKLLIQGTLSAVNQHVENGFLVGSATIKNDNREMTVLFQNEYLFVQSNDSVIESSPDIFVVLDLATLQPLPSANLSEGVKVALLSLPAPLFWTSDAAKSVLLRDGYTIS